MIRLLFVFLAICGACKAQQYQYGPVTKFASTAASWTPLTPGNLEGWWKADAGAYQDLGTTLCVNNTTCEQLNDQSGKGVTATQTTSGNRGNWLANMQNGLPAIRNDGSRWMAINSMSVSAGSKSFFLVYSNASTTAVQFCFDTSTGRLVIAPISNSGTARAGWFDGTWREFTTVTTGWHTFIWVLTASGNGHVYMDGTELGAGAAYSSQAIGGTTALWARFDGSSSPMNGDWGEQGVYSIALDASNRASLQSYLKARWNTP